MDASVLCKSRTDLGQSLDSHVGTDAIVPVNSDLPGLARLRVLELGLEGDNFFLEKAGLLGPLRLLVRTSSESVLGGTVNAQVLGHVLGQNTHGDLAVGGLRMRLEELGKLGDGSGASLLACSLHVLGRINLPILCAHTLNTSTDTDVNHTSLNLVRNIHTSLQTGRALPVQRPHSSRLREPSHQTSATHLSRATTRSKDGADADILHQSRVDLGAVDGRLQDAGDEVCGGGVLETALSALGEGAAAGGCDDDIVGAFLEDLVAAAGGWVARNLAAELGDSVESCDCKSGVVTRESGEDGPPILKV